MPENQAAERTEQPTSRRLEKAKEQGRTPQSVELASALTLFALVASIAILAPQLMSWATTLMKEGLSCDAHVFASEKTFLDYLNTRIADSMIVSLPIYAAVCAAGIAASLAVGGLNFAAQAVNFKLDAINPITGLQNLFNSRSAVQFLASILKLVFVAIISAAYLRSKMDVLTCLGWVWSAEILSAIARIIFGLCIRICIALLLLAIADTIYQKWKYIDDLKMTRQEVKQEHRDTEGAPEVKIRIRKLQLAMSMKRMLKDIPKAKVVLVNPTHVAVALKYEPEMESPVMVAKGADHIAEKIMEIARAYGVPIVRRPEIARTLYSTVDIGQPIPQNLYVAVAEVLAMLHRLRKRRR
jgi:flagellar biosynthetic protein FlhB